MNNDQTMTCWLVLPRRELFHGPGPDTTSSHLTSRGGYPKIKIARSLHHTRMWHHQGNLWKRDA
eukprot:12924908-Prorocentrum_lima.AAC.1